MSALFINNTLEVIIRLISLSSLLYSTAKNRVLNKYLIVQLTTKKCLGLGLVKNYESTAMAYTISGLIIIVI